MRLGRFFTGVALFSAVVLLWTGGVQSQDKDKPGPDKKVAAGQLPKYWDQLGLTDTQRADIVKLTREQRGKVDKLREEIRKLDEEYAKKRVALLTDDQRKKLIDILSGEPKDKPKDTSKENAKEK
jgi:Spy/CpxP family protein refolding chaperone